MVSKLCLDWWRNYTADNTALQFANYSQYAQYSRWTSQYIELLHHSLLVFRALPFIPRFLVTVLVIVTSEIFTASHPDLFVVIIVSVDLSVLFFSFSDLSSKFIFVGSGDHLGRHLDGEISSRGHNFFLHSLASFC